MTVVVQPSEPQADQQVAGHQVVGHVVMTKEAHAQDAMMIDKSATAMIDQHALALMMTAQVGRVRVDHVEMTKELHVHAEMMTDQSALVMKNLNVVSGQVNVLKQAMIANELDDQVVAGQVLQDQVQVDQGSVAMIEHAVADQIARVEDLAGVIEMNGRQDMFQKNASTLMIR